MNSFRFSSMLHPNINAPMERTRKELIFYCIGYNGFPLMMLGIYICQPILWATGVTMIFTGLSWFAFVKKEL